MGFRAGANACYKGKQCKERRGRQAKAGATAGGGGGIGWRCEGRGLWEVRGASKGLWKGLTAQTKCSKGSVHISNASFRAWLGQPSFFFMCCWLSPGDYFYPALMILCPPLLLGLHLLTLLFRTCWCVAIEVSIHK